MFAKSASWSNLWLVFKCSLIRIGWCLLLVAAKADLQKLPGLERAIRAKRMKHATKHRLCCSSLAATMVAHFKNDLAPVNARLNL